MEGGGVLRDEAELLQVRGMPLGGRGRRGCGTGDTEFVGQAGGAGLWR